MSNLALVVADVPPNVLERAGAFWRAARHHGLDALVALAIVGIGWLVARLAAALVRGILRWARFDDAARRLLGSRTVAQHEPASLAAWAVHWILLAAAVLLALDALGFDLGTPVASRLAEVLPRIVASAVLFVAGSLIALVVGAITHRFLRTADIRAARPFGQLVTGVLVGFSVLLALEQLGLAAQFVMAVGVVALASAGLGLALAFGLGCRELVRDFVIEYLRSLDDEKPGRPD